MRKLIIAFVLMLGVPAMVSAQETPSAVSAHSVSVDILGVEYGYEWAVGQRLTLSGRVGIPPMVETAIIDHGNLEVVTNTRPAITIEPRYYTSLGRRARNGRSTLNNSSDFVMLRLTGAHMLRDNDPLEAKVIVAYGIRRAWEHWYIEPTFGGGYHTQVDEFLPHLQFRLGFLF